MATDDLNALNDSQEGWNTLAPLGVEVHEIPGDHINIIKEPHVGTLAEKLGECLDRSEAHTCIQGIPRGREETSSESQSQKEEVRSDC